tara:strand:+ start:119 stop:319 length:201 start_codon:yes stop_codon:yes gene_type:complete
MKVKELIEKLNTFNPETVVLGEFDMDGDEFIVKELIDEVYEGNGLDDSCYNEEDENKMFCIIKLNC